MNNEMKMTLAILLTVMMPTLPKWEGGHNKMLLGVKNLKKCNMTPLQLSTKEYTGGTFISKFNLKNYH